MSRGASLILVAIIIIIIINIIVFHREPPVLLKKVCAFAFVLVFACAFALEFGLVHMCLCVRVYICIFQVTAGHSGLRRRRRYGLALDGQQPRANT